MSSRGSDDPRWSQKGHNPGRGCPIVSSTAPRHKYGGTASGVLSFFVAIPGVVRPPAIQGQPHPGLRTTRARSVAGTWIGGRTQCRAKMKKLLSAGFPCGWPSPLGGSGPAKCGICSDSFFSRGADPQDVRTRRGDERGNIDLKSAMRLNRRQQRKRRLIELGQERGRAAIHPGRAHSISPLSFSVFSIWLDHQKPRLACLPAAIYTSFRFHFVPVPEGRLSF